jgi:hypothetical protein
VKSSRGVVGFAEGEVAFGIVDIGGLGAHVARYGLPQPPLGPRANLRWGVRTSRRDLGEHGNSERNANANSPIGLANGRGASPHPHPATGSRGGVAPNSTGVDLQGTAAACTDVAAKAAPDANARIIARI